MAVILVRHAKAGDREKWEGQDDLRPLTAKGTAQAEGLVSELAGYDIRRVLSSPYLRCSQTVAPLAAARDLVVEPCDDLAEGHGRAGLALVRILMGQAADTVVCTHGDVMEEVLDGLAVRRDDDTRKGAAWILEPGATNYLQPPA